MGSRGNSSRAAPRPARPDRGRGRRRAGADALAIPFAVPGDDIAPWRRVGRVFEAGRGPVTRSGHGMATFSFADRTKSNVPGRRARAGGAAPSAARGCRGAFARARQRRRGRDVGARDRRAPHRRAAAGRASGCQPRGPPRPRARAQAAESRAAQGPGTGTADAGLEAGPDPDPRRRVGGSQAARRQAGGIRSELTLPGRAADGRALRRS